jgi:peptide/nickel transport system permease protein
VAKYIFSRILQALPTLFVVSLVVFTLISWTPGDPIDQFGLNDPTFSQEDYQRLRAAYGLDKPWFERYGRWISRVVTQFDLGYSRRYGISATTVIFEQRLPNTLLLSGASLVIALAVAVPVGVLSATKQYSFFDYLFTFINFAGISVPVFWLGMLGIWFFSVQLPGIFPAGGLSSPEVALPITGQEDYWREMLRWLGDRLHHLILPAVTLASIQMAAWTRFMRSSMLEVMNQDYVRTARSKGVRERRVTYKHALRNALLPIITLVGLAIPQVVNGAVLTETVFAWPGMGRAIVEAILNKDFPVAMAAILLSAVMIVAFNIVTDIVYALVDPRISYT